MDILLYHIYGHIDSSGLNIGTVVRFCTCYDMLRAVVVAR